MAKKSNYSYIGIAFIILVFGVIFIPKIVDRIQNKDIVREDSRSNAIAKDAAIKTKDSDLNFLVIISKHVDV